MLTPEIAIDLMNDALHVVMLLVVLLVTPGLITGLAVALFQAATQINEQTLGFLPRLLVTLLVLSITARWIIGYLMDFCVSVFQRAASLLG
jgi:flagellar biosynthetic protein FliQ